MLRDRLVGAWRALLDAAYPRDCVFCGEPAGPEGYVCARCLARLPLARNPACERCGAESPVPGTHGFLCPDCLRHPPAFARAHVVARYAGPVRDLIHLFKYHRGLWLRDDLGDLLAAHYLACVAPLGVAFDAIVPVPMLRAKERRRGYNQALLLAEALAARVGLPCRARYLRRVDTGVVSQTRLRRAERLRNAEAAYRAAHPRHLAGKTILLVDDVITTGATCDACARLLRRAGARAVHVLALARPLME